MKRREAKKVCGALLTIMYYTRIVSCSILHIIRVWCAQLHVRFHLNRCGLFREITERSREREEEKEKKPYQNPYIVAVKRSEEKEEKNETQTDW